jgi:trehalose 6-phosphate phosphatase
MKSLFAKDGLSILESLSFTDTLYAFDFDGTLSKIVRVPEAAAISPSVVPLLKELSKRASVAVVSGRKIGDLAPRLHFKPTYLIGNHGLEGSYSGALQMSQAVKASAKWIKVFESQALDPGIQLENKQYSIAIHYRHAVNKKRAQKEILAIADHLSPKPRIVGGKSVVNLLPHGAPHKGAALLELIKKSKVKQAFYIGDDDTDEDVFGLVDAPVLSVRVGRKKSSAARYYIERQSQMKKLLSTILKFHANGV